LDARPRRYALVSEPAPLPPDQAQGLGRRLRAPPCRHPGDAVAAPPSKRTTKARRTRSVRPSRLAGSSKKNVMRGLDPRIHVLLQPTKIRGCPGLGLRPARA